MGSEIPGGGWRGRLYLSPHSHHQNDSCIKVGSDESLFLCLIYCEGHSHKTVSTDHSFWRERSEGYSHETVSTDHNFWREKRAEAEPNWGPSAYQPNTLLEGQTGLHHQNSFLNFCTCIFSQENFARLLVRLLGAHTLQNPCSDSSSIWQKMRCICICQSLCLELCSMPDD